MACGYSWRAKDEVTYRKAEHLLGIVDLAFSNYGGQD